MKIGVVTPVWKRLHIVGAYCLMIERLRNDFPDLFVPLVVVSNETDRKMFDAFNIEACEFPNEPLGAKWNFGLKQLQGRVDAVMFLGSDDVISSSYIRNVLARIEQNDIIWGRGLFILSLDKIQFGHLKFLPDSCRNYGGVGRTYSSWLLDKVDWHIWDDNSRKFLDSESHHRCAPLARRIESFRLDSTGDLILDIKSQVGMNGFKRYFQLQDFDVEILWNKLSPPEADYLQDLVSLSWQDYEEFQIEVNEAVSQRV